MRLRCLFFGRLREAAGIGQAEWDIDEGVDADGLWDTLPARAAGFGAYREFTRIAVNGTLVRGAELLAEGDEVAFLPPVSGG